MPTMDRRGIPTMEMEGMKRGAKRARSQGPDPDGAPAALPPAAETPIPTEGAGGGTTEEV